MKVYQQLLNGVKGFGGSGAWLCRNAACNRVCKKIKVIGYDKSEYKINCYKRGIDATGEVGDEAIRNTTALFSDDDSVLDNASFYIVAVPTPIAEDKTPNLSFLINASRDVGRHLKKVILLFSNPPYIRGLQRKYAFRYWRKNPVLSAGRISRLDIHRSV